MHCFSSGRCKQSKQEVAWRLDFISNQFCYKLGCTQPWSLNSAAFSCCQDIKAVVHHTWEFYSNKLHNNTNLKPVLLHNPVLTHNTCHNIFYTNPTGPLQLSPSDTIFSQISICEEVISSQSCPISAEPSYVLICRLHKELEGWFHLPGSCTEHSFIKSPANWQRIILTDELSCYFFGHYVHSCMARLEVRTAVRRVIRLFSWFQEKPFAFLCFVYSPCQYQISVKLIANPSFKPECS